MTVQEEKRSLSGVVLDSLWLWSFLCLLTLFTYLVWAVIEVQNHYYFATAPFSSSGVRIP